MNKAPSFRCYVKEYLGNNKALFVCFAAGHEFRSTILTPKQWQWRLTRKSESSAQFLARYWRKENSGVHMECPTCKKEQQ